MQASRHHTDADHAHFLAVARPPLPVLTQPNRWPLPSVTGTLEVTALCSTAVPRRLSQSNQVMPGDLPQERNADAAGFDSPAPSFLPGTGEAD